ncbi:MAG: hypothetical protein A2Z45_08205 [Chloroflexi bacterium RBG_19FT_COMBO_55_16]|nr:MAG: hypothetical protein A2Z45_08205 [Chloroflexi bacterium RBG_19FT_COMBO_55_16]
MGNKAPRTQEINEQDWAEEVLRRRAEELARLHAISLEITASHSLPDLLQIIVKRAARLLNAPGGSLWLCDQERQEVTIHAESYPLKKDYTGVKVKIGEGAAGVVAQTGKPLIIDDYRVWPGRASIFEQDQPYSAVLSVPLLWQGQVIGVLQVLDDINLRRFTETDLELLTLFANQSTIAIENARLVEREEKRVAQLELLRQTSLSLTASLDLSEVLDRILECTLNLLAGANNGHIFLYHPESGSRLTFGAALWPDGRRGQPVAEPRPEGLTYTVARLGEPILVPDMRTHPLYTSAPSSWTGSIFSLPLKIGERVVGVMNVSHTKPGGFSESDLQVLRLFGDQAAIAIENARLYQEAATERRHLSLLYDMGRELAPSLDADEILQRAAQLTSRALGGTYGKAYLFLPEENRLYLRGVSGYSEEQFNILRELSVFDLGEGLAGWVALNRQPLLLSDVQQDARWKHVPGCDEEVHSAIVATILQGERLLGVFTLLHHEVAAFTPDHLDLLQAICQQVGLTLSNVERYQQVQTLVDLLATEQKRLENLVERLPVGVLLLDANYQMEVVNSFGREILSLLGAGGLNERLVQLGPHTIDDLVNGDHESLPVEILIEEPAKMMLEVEILSLGVERAQWVVMMRDVTQERQNQARIQMQERLATVGQLAAGIAHDFNNIMAAILVYTDLLKKDLEFVPTGRERLTIIQQQVQRAASLIRQILDFSRRSVMEQSTLDMLPFIKELDKLLARVLPETIRVELTYQPDTYLVNADPARLQQVFMNLAVNARDAMPEGGTLRFALNRLRLQTKDNPPAPYLTPGEWAAVTVSDTGTGIVPKAMPHIFEPFFTTKPAGQGTGLGLAQAYGIIKQHDGYIDVQSKPGTGTSFTIYLPALPSPEVAVSPEQESYPAEGMGETILVVEDDEVTRTAMQALLEAQNYRVITAGDGGEALNIFEQNPDGIALLVSDVVMPKMGGVALYRILRDRWPQVKMLLVTGHPLQEENQTLLEENQVCWMQKPFSVPEFCQAVKVLLDGNGRLI